MAKGILLDAGTNEMEMLEFRLCDTRFGINVAKIREITQRIHTVSIPHSPYAVEGSFMLRDKVLTLVNLGQYFDMAGEEISKGEGLVIIVEFNNVHCGILVDAVERIHRLSWSQIEQPSEYLMNYDIPITGMVNIEDNTILIVDFETIVNDILGINCADNLYIDANAQVSEKDIHILFADDSSFMRKTMVNILNRSGYNNITICNDGQQAWETMQEIRDSDDKHCDLVLSDIEMPRMDGLHLTAKIKQDQKLKDIPVVLFSSLITDDNRKKGESVGADVQVNKPDSEGMIKAIEGCMSKIKQKQEPVLQ